MAYVCLTPLAFAGVVVAVTLRDWRSYPGQLLVVGSVAATGIALYFLRREIAAKIAGRAMINPAIINAATQPTVSD